MFTKNLVYTNVHETDYIKCINSCEDINWLCVWCVALDFALTPFTLVSINNTQPSNTHNKHTHTHTRSDAKFRPWNVRRRRLGFSRPTACVLGSISMMNTRRRRRPHTNNEHPGNIVITCTDSHTNTYQIIVIFAKLDAGAKRCSHVWSNGS